MSVLAHAQGVANRDVKLENTLLVSSARPLIKLCDFGYSKVGPLPSVAMQCCFPLASVPASPERASYAGSSSCHAGQTLRYGATTVLVRLGMDARG